MKRLLVLLVLVTLVAGYWLLIKKPEPKVMKGQRLAVEVWQAFAEKYEEKGRILDKDNQGISHSEGQGYGLLFAEAAGDQQGFERIWRWTQQTLQRPDGLFSWKFEPCVSLDRQCVTDKNNATDAELLIAWALIKADQRWHKPEYLQEATRISQAVAKKLLLLHQGELLLLPGIEGFVKDKVVTVNASYLVFPALEALAEAFPEQPWQKLIKSGRRQLISQGAGVYGLPPDWADHTLNGFQPSSFFPARYSYDAVRVPLHLAWLKQPLVIEEFKPYLSFWAANDPVPAWISLAENKQAEYAWSTGMQAIAKFVKARVNNEAIRVAELPKLTEDDGYFSWSLVLLTHLAINETQQDNGP